MISQQMARELPGTEVIDSGGSKVGKVGQVWLDGETNEPEWVSVRTGMFGTKESFVPLTGADAGDNTLRVAVDKSQVKDAPRIDASGRLSSSDEEQLYRHYGMRYEQPQPDIGRTAETERARTRETGSDDDAMTRSEERLNVGTETAESGRVRLRKHVVTEEQQVNVPVQHEEVHVEREPISAQEAGRYDTTIGEDEREMTVHSERPVVSKEQVPVEKVRLDKESRDDRETVTGEVRKEEIDVDDTTGQEYPEGRRHRNR